MTTAKTISFRAQSEKIKILDGLATLQDRDRTYLLNEALDHYLDLNKYHFDQIQQGLKQADAGKLLDHASLKRRVMKLRNKK